jgi:hypothetical protein
MAPLFLILRKYEAYYVYMFGRHNNLQADYHNYTIKPQSHTPNRMISRILGRAGITVRAKTKDSPLRMLLRMCFRLFDSSYCYYQLPESGVYGWNRDQEQHLRMEDDFA